MKKITIAILCFFTVEYAFAQISDTVADAIKKLLLHKEISDVIFFRYDEPGSRPISLPPGNYAFIIPDSTYQKVDKQVLSDLPYMVATSGYVFKKEFYKDSTHSIYINGDIGSELFIVFAKISIYEKTADISFYTTSRRDQRRFQQRYVNVTASLSNIHGKWQVKYYQMKLIGWTEFIKIRYINHKN